MTHGAELTEEGGAAVLRRDFDMEKGPPWPATASEVTGSRRSGGGYSGGAFCMDRRRWQWSSQRLQCQSKGKGKRGRDGSVVHIRGRGGSSASDTTWRRGENGARHPDSCAGAAETGAGRVVSGAMREQGSGQRAWAARERGGRSREGRSWAGPERIVPILI
jgi:hypothetical protein